MRRSRHTSRLERRLRARYKHWKTDVYVVSFPKAGRTWLRVMIGKALCERFQLPEELLLDTFALTKRAGIRRTRMTHDGSAIADGQSYRQLSSDKLIYRRKRVVLLVRNVKDLLVSCYFQATRRAVRFEGPISEFIRDERYGAAKVLTFYNAWFANRHVPRELLVIRYEDMHGEPQRVLAQVLKMMGMDEIDEPLLRSVVEYSAFTRMKELERSRRFKDGIMQPKQEGNDESSKVRRGVVGGYRDYLTEKDVLYVDELIREQGWPPEHLGVDPTG